MHDYPVDHRTPEEVALEEILIARRDECVFVESKGKLKVMWVQGELCLQIECKHFIGWREMQNDKREPVRYYPGHGWMTDQERIAERHLARTPQAKRK